MGWYKTLIIVLNCARVVREFSCQSETIQRDDIGFRYKSTDLILLFHKFLALSSIRFSNRDSYCCLNHYIGGKRVI